MTETAATADSSTLVPGVHRVVRIVDAGEGPFSGALVAYGDGVVVCVDAQELSGWSGWAHSDAEHVCGVVDIRRRREGQDALVPWCTQRVETFLGRRRAADAPLVPGEVATLAASFLRGLRELGDAAQAAIGDWWLTGDGRPLFVHGEGGAARSRAAGLVEKLTAHTGDRATGRILEAISGALRERRHPHDEELRWEEELFAMAAPRALRLDVFAPEKSADVHTGHALRPAGEARHPLRRSLRQPRTPEQRAWQQLGSTTRAFSGALIDSVRSLRTQRSERRSRGEAAPRSAPASTRKRALIVAGAVAGLVLVAGLMWPEGQDPEAQASTGSPAGTSDADASSVGATEQAAAETDAPHHEPSPATEKQVLDAVPGLLHSIAACIESGAERCPEALAAGVAMPSTGPVALGPDRSVSELVDDYGDVAVVRLTPTDANAESAAQIVVFERDKKKWLVRDIYDVAHQPE